MLAIAQMGRMSFADQAECFHGGDKAHAGWVCLRGLATMLGTCARSAVLKCLICVGITYCCSSMSYDRRGVELLPGAICDRCFIVVSSPIDHSVQFRDTMGKALHDRRTVTSLQIVFNCHRAGSLLRGRGIWQHVQRGWLHERPVFDSTDIVFTVRLAASLPL
jgi:hypothetical protein